MTAYNEEFLRGTWRAWQAGLLNQLSPTFSEIAQKPFEVWLKDNPGMTKRELNQFWQTNCPLPNEFLILGQWEAIDELVLVVTNIRVWMRKSKRDDFKEFLFADMLAYEAKLKTISHMVTITLKTGEKRSFKVGLFPMSANCAEFLISRASSDTNWESELAQARAISARPEHSQLAGSHEHLSTADPSNNALDIAESSGLPRGVVGIAAFALYMLVNPWKMEDAGSAAIVLIGGLFLAFASEEFHRNIYGSPAKKQRGGNSPPSTTDVPSETSENASELTICPNCGQQSPASATKCLNCHASLGPLSAAKPTRTYRPGESDA